MSKKKMKVDPVEVDRDLDFDDFDMGFPDLSDDREPTSKPGKAFAKGLKSGITDSALIGEMMKKNLPREYGDAFDTLSEVASGAKSFSDDVIKDAKPIIGNLANAADKFLPSSFKATKERLSKLRDWAEREEGSSKGPSKEEQRKMSTGIELGRIFEQQQQLEVVKDKISRKEKDFDRGIDMAQHKDILSVLTKLSNSNERVAGYTTTINSAWQRKTLETQFHQLFVLQDILEESKKSNAEVISNLTAITKNSALPEYRKTHKDEAFMEEARKRFSGKIVDASSNFFRKGLMKMRSDVSSVAGDLASITSMLSMAGDLNAMEDEFDPKTMTDKLSGAGGSMAGKWLLSKGVGALVNTAKKNPNIVKKIGQGQNFIKSMKQDGAGLFKEYLNRKEESGDGGFMTILADYLNNSFNQTKPNYGLISYDAKNMYNVSPFTNKVAYSITDVIPGYLSRILQEQTTMRTGRDAELVKFDYSSGKFATSKSIVDRIRKSISAEELSSSNGGYFREILAKIEETTDLNDDERSQIAKAYLKKGVDDSSLDPEKMTDQDHWRGLGFSEELAAKMSTFSTNLYGTTKNKEFYHPNADPQKKAEALAFNDHVKYLKNARKDKHAEAQYAIDEGNTEEAIKAGLLDKDGRYNVDLIDRNTTQIKGSYKGKGSQTSDILKDIAESKTNYAGQDEGIVQGVADRLKKILRLETDEERAEREAKERDNSDVNIKDHITKADNVLDSVSQLPISKWRYKPGHWDGGKTENIGPMAQDMNKQFGEEVAPTGKKIDLVNANGIAFKAIQELNEKVDGKTRNFKGFADKEPQGESSILLPDVLSCLRGIHYNTEKMVGQGLVMINMNIEGIKNMAAAFGQQLGKIDLSQAGDKAKAAYGKASTFVKENTASSILGKLGDFISRNTGDAIKGGLERGGKLIASSYRGAKKTMGFAKGEIGNLLDNVKIKALETFDVYMPGEKEPRMIAVKMRQGLYIDFIKQSPVKTRKDVREAVEGITEIQTNGDMEIILTGKELADAIFVNTHKTAIEKVLKGGINTIRKGIVGGFNNVFMPSFKGAAHVMKLVKGGLAKVLDQPVDVYLKSNPSKCVLLAKVMREGGYRDEQDGSIIERPGQIKGAVFDIAKGEIAVSIDEYREGLVDIHGKALGFSAFSIGKSLVGAAIGAGSSIMSWTMNKISKAPGILGKLAKKGTEMMKTLASKLGIPSFTLGNFFGTQAVDILKDIKGILLYQAGLAAAPKIEGVKATASKAARTFAKKKAKAAGANAGPETGLALLDNVKAVAGDKPNVNDVDPNKPVSTTEVKSEGFGLGSKLIGGLGSIASFGASLFKRKKNKGGEEPIAEEGEKTEQDKEQDTKLSKLSKTLKGFKDKLKGKKEDVKDAVKRAKIIGQDGIQKTADGLKIGSWQEREKNKVNVNDVKERDKADVKVYATRNIFKMIADTVGAVRKKLSSWLSKDGDPGIDAEDIADAADDLGDRKGKRGRRGRGGKGGRGKLGKVGRLGKPGLWGKTKDVLSSGANKIGNFGTGVAKGTMNGIGKGASTVGGLIKGGVSAAGGIGTMAKVGMRGLGYAGAAYGAYSAYDNFKEGNYGMAALDATGAIASGALATGGLAALGSTTAAIGSGLLAAGGTALAVLTSPVTLTVLAAAGAIYGGYKLYQYLTRKEFNYTEVMRMLEYGLRGADTDKMRKINELELYLETVSSVSQDAWTLDDKKFDIKQVYSIFDIDEKNQARVTSFNSWFNNRFKPVFGKWKLLLKTIGNTDSIAWLEKASSTKILEVYKGFKLHHEAYKVEETPFSDIKLNTDVSVIENFKLEWIKSLKIDAEKSKDKDLTKEVIKEGKKTLEEIKPGDKVPGSAALPVAKAETDFDKKVQEAADKYNGRITPQDVIKSAVPTIGADYGTQPPTTAQSVGVDEPESKEVGDKAASAPTSKPVSPGGAPSIAGATGELLSGSNASKFLTMGKNVNINGLHPSMKRLFLGMVEEYGQLTGKNIQVNRAFSSTQEQAALYKQYGPGKAAKPGTSLHEFGLAIDAQSSDLDAMDKLGLLRKYGFTRPLGSEPWHLEPAGIFDNGVRQKAKGNPSFAESYIESGVGRGGGGLGSRGRKGDLIRDDTYAKMLFNAASKTIDVAKKDEAPLAAAKDMTKAATEGSSTALAKGGSGMPNSIGVGEVESKEGKVPSTVGSGNASQASFDKTAKAANDNTMKASQDIAQGKGKGGAYQNLPDTKGDGWENNKDMILASARMVGLDPALAAAIAAKESSFRPGAQGINSATGNSTAQGLYQFMPGTWKEMVAKHGSKYGIAAGTSPLDARANAILGMEYIKASLSKGDGSPHEAYLGHMLGAAGLSRFKDLKGSDIPAQSFQGQAANNLKVFFDGGDRKKPFTKDQMIASLNGSLNKNLQAFNVPLTLKGMPAANDTQMASAKQTESTSTLASSGSSSIVKASYTAPVEERAQVNSMAAMANQAPVSSMAATAPVLENTNNGVGRLEKVSNDQLKEQKATNVILTEIRDILAKSFDNASAVSAAQQKPIAAKAEKIQTSTPAAKTPSQLPDSYVQRRRA